MYLVLGLYLGISLIIVAWCLYQLFTSISKEKEGESKRTWKRLFRELDRIDNDLTQIKINKPPNVYSELAEMRSDIDLLTKVLLKDLEEKK